MLLEFITTLTEGIRTPHPEDFILNGSQAASDAIDGILSAVSNPNIVSIKWDGSPAIIFGRRPADGQFTMNYKEYIGLPGGQVTSAKELLDFYIQQGKNIDVGQKLANMFNAVASIVPAGFKGFIQGDVMWTESVQPEQGYFVFQANPHGVQYRVKTNSAIGKEIQGRPFGLAVHTVGSDVVKTTKGVELVGKTSLQGLGGLSKSNQYITVFTGTMGANFKLKEPVQQVKAAKAAVKAFAGLNGDAFLASLTQSTIAKLQTYYNKKYTGQAVDANWLANNITKPQYAILAAEENRPIMEAMDAVYVAIYALKLAVLDQLEPQVQSVEQYVYNKSNNTYIPKGEGFVINTPSGMIKLVNRGVFSTANVQGRL
jgi:hypothetical protein